MNIHVQPLELIVELLLVAQALVGFFGVAIYGDWKKRHRREIDRAYRMGFQTGRNTRFGENPDAGLPNF